MMQHTRDQCMMQVLHGCASFVVAYAYAENNSSQLRLYLQKEEEHGLDLVLGPCDNEDPPVSSQVVSARDHCLDGLSHAVFHIDQVVFSTDKDPTRPILAAWDRNEEVGSVVHRFGGLADDMVQPQVELIQH